MSEDKADGRNVVRRSLREMTVVAVPSDGYAIRCVAPRRLGSAVIRNSLKRKIREGWRKRCPRGDFTFILKPPITHLNASKISDLLDEVAGTFTW